MMAMKAASFGSLCQNLFLLETEFLLPVNEVTAHPDHADHSPNTTRVTVYITPNQKHSLTLSIFNQSFPDPEAM